jgi:hypothetical protein
MALHRAEWRSSSAVIQFDGENARFVPKNAGRNVLYKTILDYWPQVL